MDDDFLSNLKGSYSTCAYFSNENIKTRLRQKIEKPSDGLFRYHNRIVISLPANDWIKALLFEYHDNANHPHYRRLMTSLLERYWWNKMTLGFELYYQHCVICNGVKTDRSGGASLQLLGTLEYPCYIFGFHYVIDLPKSGSYGHTIVFSMVCHLTKMAHFVPCHKEITEEESSYLFISNCYRLHNKNSK